MQTAVDCAVFLRWEMCPARQWWREFSQTLRAKVAARVLWLPLSTEVRQQCETGGLAPGSEQSGRWSRFADYPANSAVHRSVQPVALS